MEIKIKMALIRKILPIGGSQAITLPSDWLKWVEHETGQKPTQVLIEINGILKVSPVIEKKPT